MDAFDVLALAPAFDLDTNELEQRYRDLQKQLHPDRFVQASASEKRASLSRAVDVNQAYRVLRDDLKRAEVLLARVAKDAGAEVAADPQLLMEVMELREGLQEAKAERNHTAVESLAGDVKSRETEARGELSTAFAALLTGQTSLGQDTVTLTRARNALSKLRYYRRFQDEVARFQEETSE